MVLEGKKVKGTYVKDDVHILHILPYCFNFYKNVFLLLVQIKNKKINNSLKIHI